MILQHDHEVNVAQYFLHDDYGFPVGEAQLHHSGGKLAELWAVEVYPRYRGLGYGRALVVEMMKRSRQRGYTVLALWVREDNTKAIGLYRDLGFYPGEAGDRGLRMTVAL